MAFVGVFMMILPLTVMIEGPADPQDTAPTASDSSLPERGPLDALVPTLPMEWTSSMASALEETPDAVVIEAMVRYPPNIGAAFTCPGIPSDVQGIACTVPLASPIGSRTLLAHVGSTVEPIDTSTAINGSIYTGMCPTG